VQICAVPDDASVSEVEGAEEEDVEIDSNESEDSGAEGVLPSPLPQTPPPPPPRAANPGEAQISLRLPTDGNGGLPPVHIAIGQNTVADLQSRHHQHCRCHVCQPNASLRRDPRRYRRANTSEDSPGRDQIRRRRTNSVENSPRRDRMQHHRTNSIEDSPRRDLGRHRITNSGEASPWRDQIRYRRTNSGARAPIHGRQNSRPRRVSFARQLVAVEGVALRTTTEPPTPNVMIVVNVMPKLLQLPPPRPLSLLLLLSLLLPVLLSLLLSLLLPVLLFLPLPLLPPPMCRRSSPLPSMTCQGMLVCPELALLRRHHRRQEIPWMWTARQPSLAMVGTLAIEPTIREVVLLVRLISD
jgi:hypothetical protein